VFFEKGYEGASMRDLSRATGMSLAGLYYYFQSKERLLYLIQKHTFETIVAQLQQRLAVVDDPEQRVRTLITNHLQYFLANQKAMTVLSHEDEVLKGKFGEEIRDIKRKYYQTCRDLVEALKVERGLNLNTRTAVLSLFGMMNWIYTWYRPHSDSDAETLAGQMGDIFLRGVLGAGSPKRSRIPVPRQCPAFARQLLRGKHEQS
jgi:TetR/AcrR family transcriptional regulator, cholesterol catabolism regulator